jgi:serine protease inhibitor
MVSTVRLNYLSTSHFEVVEIPYACRDVSFVVLLPTEGFDSARMCIDMPMLTSVMENLSSSREKTNVVLPTFQVAAGYPITYSLECLGVNNIFYWANADVGGIIGGGGDLFVSNVTQTVLMKIDVNQATSAQTNQSTCSGPEKEEDKDDEEMMEHDKLVIVNCPFVYVLWDKLAMTPLLIGQLCDPVASVIN